MYLSQDHFPNFETFDYYFEHVYVLYWDFTLKESVELGEIHGFCSLQSHLEEEFDALADNLEDFRFADQKDKIDFEFIARLLWPTCEHFLMDQVA